MSTAAGAVAGIDDDATYTYRVARRIARRAAGRALLPHPAHLAVPAEPIVGAEAVNRLLREWRETCNYEPAAPAHTTGKEAEHVPMDGLARAAGVDR